MKRIFAIISAMLALAAAANAQQLPNMDFDTWSKSGGTWYLYAKDATPEQKVWDSSNKGLSLLGVNGTTPEYKHVAVSGEGKAACKIESKKVLWAFVAGNLFTGRFAKVVNFSGADLYFGVPFTARPKSLSGYYHYIPGTINYAEEPYEDLKGRQDEGSIEVILTDWDQQYHIITNNERFIDGATDPHVIGRAALDIKAGTDGYVHFEIPFEYRSGQTPKYIVISAASSRLGAYFTGSSKSVLYLDEFQLNY